MPSIHLRHGQTRPARAPAPRLARLESPRNPPPLRRARPRDEGAGPQSPPTSATATRATTRRDFVLAAAALTPCACALCATRTAGYKRFFAKAMAEMMEGYEENVAPVKARLFATHLGALRAAAPARPLAVLDLGVGAAPNAKYLSAAGPGVVGRVVGVDPNPFMFGYATAAAAAAGFSVACGEEAARAALEDEDGAEGSAPPPSPSRPTFSTVQAPAEALPFPDASFDAVVCTLVLCSVASVPDALTEAARVLRPGGRFIFSEHTVVGWKDRPVLRAAQTAFNPLQQLLADGCHLTRDAAGAIASAPGLKTLSLDRFDVEGMGFIGPHVAGAAERVVL